MRLRLLFIIGVLLAPDYAAAQCSNADGAAALSRGRGAWRSWCIGCGYTWQQTGSNPVCIPSGGGGFAPPPDPLQTNLPQFNDFVRQAAPHLPNGNWFLSLPPPASIGDLEQRLQQMYDGLHRQEQTWRFRQQRAREDEEASAQRLRKLEQEQAHLQQSGPVWRSRASQLSAEAADFERRGNETMRARNALDAETRYWAEVAQRSRQSAVKWINVVIPDRFLKIDRNAWTQARIPSGLGVVPGSPLAAASLVPAPASMPLLVPSLARGEAVTSSAPALQGDIPSRIALALQIPPRLNYMKDDINRIRSREYYREKSRAEINRRLPEMRAEFQRMTDAEARLGKAQEQLARARRELAAVQQSYAYRVSEALLWQLATEKVVKPELRRLAREKMWFGNIDSLTDLEVEGLFDRGQKIWNGWFIFRGQDNFFEVQDKTIALIRQPQEFALEAVDVFRRGSPSEIQAFAEKVFARLEATTGEYGKAALKNLTGFAPFDEISHKLAGFR